MPQNLLDIPTHILVAIDNYLPKNIEWLRGVNITRQINIWEYLVGLNRKANQISLNYCYHQCVKILTSTPTPMTNNNYQESLKIYRSIITSKHPVLYIMKYHVTLDSYLKKGGQVWECYSDQNFHQSMNDYIIKILGMMGTCLETEMDSNKDYYPLYIKGIDMEKWEFYHQILMTIFGINLSKPKVGDSIICEYILKYPEVCISKTTGSYAIYTLYYLDLLLTREQLKQEKIKQIVLDNIDNHIYHCYYYDDCCGELVLDSIDNDLAIYKEKIKNINDNIGDDCYQ